jgi:hypothetical protein
LTVIGRLGFQFPDHLSPPLGSYAEEANTAIDVIDGKGIGKIYFGLDNLYGISNSSTTDFSLVSLTFMNRTDDIMLEIMKDKSHETSKYNKIVPLEENEHIVSANVTTGTSAMTNRPFTTSV